MQKYAAFSLVFAPFLFPYYFPGTTINLETIFILINGIIFYNYNKKKQNSIKWPSYFKYFLIYSLLIPFFGYLCYGNFGGVKSTYVTFLPFVVCLIQIKPLIVWNLLVKYYKKLAYLSIIFFVIQEIMYYSLGWRLMGLLPFMPVSYSYTTMNAFIDHMSHLDRSMSFFLEPAHYAQYILGYLALSLAKDSKDKKIFSKESIFISLALLLTWSGTAIVCMGVLWIVYFFNLNIRSIIKYIIIIPSVICGIGIGYYYISHTDKGQKMMDRTEELSVNQSRMSSGMMRIFRGYFVYEGMPNSQKLIGVGTGFVPDVINHSKYLFMFYEYERYVNTAQVLLIGEGLFGSFIFLIFLLKLIKKGNPYPLYQVSLLISLSLVESYWMTGRMLLYLSIAYCSFKYVTNKKLIFVN